MTDQLPSFLQGYSGSLDSLNLPISSNAVPILSIEGGQFNLIDINGESEKVGNFDAKLGLYVDAVIADCLEVMGRTYFGAKYDPANPAPPMCFSDNGVAPSKKSGAPQSATCASCQFNMPGSAVSLKGKPIRACRSHIKLAVILPDFPDEAFLLRVPPNSHKSFGKYYDTLVKHKIPVETIVTRVYFEPGVQGTLNFTGARRFGEQDKYLFDSMLRQKGQKLTDALIGRGDVPIQGLLPAPAQQGAQAAQLPPPGQQFTQSSTAASAPLAPAQPAAQQSTGVFAAQPAATAQSAAPSPQPEPQRRRRRTRAEIDAASGQTPAPHQPVQQAQPMQPVAQAPGPFAQGPAIVSAIHAQPGPASPLPGSAQPNNFGMQAAQNSTPEIDAALKDIFG